MASVLPGNVPLNTGTGPKTTRTLTITTMQPDGSELAVEMEVVSIATANGRLLDFGNMEDVLLLILDELKQIKFHMEVHS